MTQIFNNNATTTLSASLASGTTSMSVGSSGSFTAPTGEDFLMVTLIRASDSAIEVIKVTNITGTTWTIVRAQEGTTALDFIAGDKVELRVTAGFLQGLQFGRLLNVRVITTTQTYTPTTGTKSVLVECVGGGGGGVGVPSVASGYKSGGSGGWGGSYAKSHYTSGFSGVTVTVGAGGAGGLSTGENGSEGGTTSFGALISCPGGSGGLYLPPTNSTNAAVSYQGPAPAPTGGNIVMHRGEPGGDFFILNDFNMPLGGGATALGSWGDDHTVATGYGAGAPSRYQNYGNAAKVGKPGSNGVVIIYEYA
jgi:hypothetical protein